jgi:hypothetical protein
MISYPSNYFCFLSFRDRAREGGLVFADLTAFFGGPILCGEEAEMGKSPVKIDLWAENKKVYSPGAKPELVTVPPLTYLAVDGTGDPNTSAAFREAIGSLYTLAFTLKFASKKSGGPDFRVMPLSGLYHGEAEVFLAGRKDEWKWTLMIPVPSFVTAAALKKARAEIEKKKGPVPGLDLVSRRVVREGRSAQVMHRGPYAGEKETIEGLHAFIRESGLVIGGSHHEIYLSDPNRTAPEKMKTIIRYPVRKG